jgi:hypothetical protein
MNRFGRTILGVLLLAASVYFAWPALAPAADDWQPVDPADLALKDNPKAPGADAMILYAETRVNEPKFFTESYTRMKIFTKEGLKHADVEIPYAKGLEVVNGIRGRTIHPDGTIAGFDGKTFDKVEEKGRGIRVFAKTFTLPEALPGSIVEYKYDLVLDAEGYYFSYQEWSPQREVFTRYVRFLIHPLTNNQGQAMQLAYRQYHLPEKLNLQETTDGFYFVEFHDVPGVEEEKLMPPAGSLRPRIEFYYKRLNEPANETMDQYWKRIDKKWDETLEKFVDKRNVLQSEVSRTTASNDSPEMKLRKLFARAQQIRNLSMENQKSKKEAKSESLKSNDNVEHVLKHGYGSERDINMLFIGLARAAGFDATQVYVSPANVTHFLPQAQDSGQLSADLVWVKAASQEYFVDPGARYFPFGLLPWTKASVQGIRLRKDAPEFVNTPDQKSTDAVLARGCDLELDQNGDAAGKLQIDFTGQQGSVRRLQNREEDEAGRKKELADEIRGWLPAESTFEVTTISNWDDTAQPLRVGGTVKIPGIGTAAGHRMLVPLSIFHDSQMDAFKSSKRVNDIYFSYPFEEQDDVKYHAPPGYKIESVPTISKMDLKALTYEVSASQQDNLVETKRHLTVQGVSFPVNAYDLMRSFFGKVKSNDETQFVLQNPAAAKGN